MLARDVMTKNPQAVTVTAPVREALEVLDTLDVRHVPVVNEQREVVGILSDRDLGSVRNEALQARVRGTVPDVLDKPVARFMWSSPISIEEDAPLSDVVDAMIENRIGAVPVVDADGTLSGIISYVDILREAVER